MGRSPMKLQYSPYLVPSSRQAIMTAKYLLFVTLYVVVIDARFCRLLI